MISKLPNKIVALLILLTAITVAAYAFFTISDPVSYFISSAFFFIGIIVSYNIAATAGFDAALSHFREVIIGSTHIGLTSIKKLSDTPPEKLAKKTKSSFRFLGISGEKFLKETLEKVEFFRRNKNPKLVKIMLMDPFSDEIDRLSSSKKTQTENRNKIISTIATLNKLRNDGYHFEIRLYPKKPPLRLLIIDDNTTALSVYEADSSGWKNAQLLFEGKDNDDSLAPYFVETFDDLWERGLNISLDQRSMALSPYMAPSKMDKKAKLGMVHGRFQPFHHEHFEYILHGISNSEKCLIGITQPNIKCVSECEILPHRGTTEGNPFTFEDRKRMISLSLERWGIANDQYEIIPFEIDKPDTALPALKDLYKEEITHFMRIFSEWEIHKKTLIEKHEMKVVVFESLLSDFMIKNVTGTLVRELVSSKRNWKDFVPFGTKQVIDAIEKRAS
jgi:nicotinamide mononucleotide adenylyltransferase